MARLKGKRALVTGAGSGLGAAIAQAFIREGASVLLTDIAEDVRRVAEELGDGASWRLQDVTDEALWPEIITEAAGPHGKLDILVNNAGISMFGPVEGLSYAQWRRCLTVDLDSVFLGTRAALPVMSASGGGSIINMSSMAGITGQPGLSAYCAAKGGVRMFSKAVALECAMARNRIRVNSVHPGIVDTPIFRTTIADERRASVGTIPLDPHALAALHTPMGRAGQPEDIASACVYLASDESTYVTGTEIVIDGGYCAA